MLGRRFPQRQRRFVHFAPPAINNITGPQFIANNEAAQNVPSGYTAPNAMPHNQSPLYIAHNEDLNLLKEADKIPLPNEEVEDNPKIERGIPVPSLFHQLKNNILLDDLILLGLIFLLIHEGCEDEIFIVILFYLLVFGAEHSGAFQ